MDGKSLVYLNGDFLPVAEARVSVLDRGFLFGDGVYEVIPCYAGKLFLLGPHLERLGHSLAGIRMRNPIPNAQWRDLLERLVADNGGGDLYIYIQVTRGPASVREHVFPATVTPTIFAMANPARPPAREAIERGVGAVTVADQRWLHCDVKAVTLLQNVLDRQAAADKGAVEAIMLRDGAVTEGAATNVFIVRGGEILTPPLGPEILPGITRRYLIECLRAAGITVAETAVNEDMLRNADEIWITSSTREVLAVSALDGKPVGGGTPGTAFRKAYALYQAGKSE